jgi:hypothetical protein
MEGTTPDADDLGIHGRRLPKWRDAEKQDKTWFVSLRSRTILSRQTIYGLHGYRTYRASRLRSAYSEIEMNLRSRFDRFRNEPWFDRDRPHKSLPS